MAKTEIVSEKVTFECQGEVLVGLLFIPAVRLGPALICEGPLTSIKEQVTSNYARALAARGFLSLAFDHRFFGESQGKPRQYESPRNKIADLQSAVSFLESRPELQGGQIGLVGVCAGAGYAAGAVASDERVHAFGAVAGFFHDAQKQREWMGDGFDKAIQEGEAARQQYLKTGEVSMIPAVGRSGPVAMPLAEAFEYYGTERGATAGYVNAFAVQSRTDTLTYDAQSAAAKIRVPTLLIHSEKALAPALAQKFYDSVSAEQKQLIWFESKGQIDFYDQPQLIEPAADALASHFCKYLL